MRRARSQVARDAASTLCLQLLLEDLPPEDRVSAMGDNGLWIQEDNTDRIAERFALRGWLAIPPRPKETFTSY